MSEYEKLVQEIKDYDSDTFFAKGCDLTEIEAKYLADRCIRFFMENDFDGYKLDLWLAEERGIA